jgi:hypothetical protein
MLRPAGNCGYRALLQGLVERQRLYEAWMLQSALLCRIFNTKTTLAPDMLIYIA